MPELANSLGCSSGAPPVQGDALEHGVAAAAAFLFVVMCAGHSESTSSDADSLREAAEVDKHEEARRHVPVVRVVRGGSGFGPHLEHDRERAQ